MRLILAMLLFAVTGTAAAGELRIPFEQDPRLSVLRVIATIDGRESVVLLDTGATHSLVAADLVGVRESNLPRGKGRRGPGIRTYGLARQIGLGIGPKRWRDRLVVAVDFSDFRDVYGEEVGGILGQDLLSQFSSVEIDYRRKMVVLRD